MSKSIWQYFFHLELLVLYGDIMCRNSHMVPYFLLALTLFPTSLHLYLFFSGLFYFIYCCTGWGLALVGGRGGRERAGTSGRREVIGKGVGGLIRCKWCVHIHVNAKIKPVETVPGIRGGRMEENSGGGKFKYNIFDRTFVNTTMYPPFPATSPSHQCQLPSHQGRICSPIW
jgi:hypothetical protein